MAENLTSRAHDALANPTLQQALSVIPEGFVNKRLKAKNALPAFDQLSDLAVNIKQHTLANITHYLEKFEQRVIRDGGQVHYAVDSVEAREIITGICRAADARVIAKGKSMVGEEIHLTQHLEGEGFEAVETDLGEYLIQLRGEMPSHIIAPAVHLTRKDIRSDFMTAHKSLPPSRALETPVDFVREARGILREKFLKADVGITGANFLIAEEGMSIIVTNEGNGDLSQSLPKTHIVITSFEKLVPTIEDANILLRLLARSATGQPITTYTTFTGGPQRARSQHGPDEYHVVILDNGRSRMLGSKFADMLRCIRCGACLNHCPVYQNVGGHAYGSVYPGPMGAVLSPQFFGKGLRELASASSFCGRCVEVCPMQIPLTRLMRFWRNDSAKDQPMLARTTMKIWAGLAKRPRLYNAAMRLVLPAARFVARTPALAKAMPGLGSWVEHRAPPAVAGRSFQSAWTGNKDTSAGAGNVG